MRIGLISDIHANYEALAAVLDVIVRLKVDKYICLGDLVGYGASPNEVMDLVRGLSEFTVMGNHDAAVAGQMDYQYYYDAAREVLRWTTESLTEANMDYLKNLPYFRILDGVCYVHGEPITPNEFNYLYTLDQAKNIHGFYDMIQSVTFVGHSHLRRVFELSPDEVLELPDENLTLRPDRKYAIAIGSVGQPRDYDPRAGFVVWDSDTRRVEFYRVEYDIDRAAEKILNAGLPEYFATRLYSGS